LASSDRGGPQGAFEENNMTVKEMAKEVEALRDEYINSINPEIRNYLPLQKLLGYEKLEWAKRKVRDRTTGEVSEIAHQKVVKIPGLVEELLVLAAKVKKK
jgi:hypothetical protein